MQPGMVQLICLAATLAAVAHPALADPATQPTARTQAGAITPAPAALDRHEQFLARAHQGSIDLLFLGDSITDAWPGAAPDVWRRLACYRPADFGVSGERTEHLLWRIANGELDGIHPQAVVI